MALLYKLAGLIGLVFILALTACTTPQYVTVKPQTSNQESDLVAASYKAVDKLIEREAVEPKLGSNTLVLVSTIQDIDNLNSSSTLGRIISEQMKSRFAMLGIPVIEVKLRGNLYVSNSQGEMMLSREIKDIGGRQKADLVLVGTYAKAGDLVYISVKLVRPEDSRITSAYDFQVPISRNNAALMNR